jgi:hypothetical protein
VRGSHHNAFKNSLTADECLLSTLQSRQKLNGNEKPKIVKKATHWYLDAPEAGETHV